MLTCDDQVLANFTNYPRYPSCRVLFHLQTSTLFTRRRKTGRLMWMEDILLFWGARGCFLIRGLVFFCSTMRFSRHAFGTGT